jgi:glucosamine--fructose-6-phosphate aminotransferase (isomerizing)
MCGVFGFVSWKNRPPDLERLKRIAVVTERRGFHAFGFAWIDSTGRLHSYKQPGRISKNLDTLDRVAGCRMMIGHTRWATHGDPADNRNNHPHAAGDGWVVHNGVIWNYNRLAFMHGIRLKSKCDSEVLAGLIEQADGNLLDRCCSAVALVDARPLAMLGIWRNPDRVIAVRDGNPLHAGYAYGGTYVGSLADELPGKVEMLKDSEAYAFGTAEETEAAELVVD